jgi:hypothetical protein
VSGSTASLGVHLGSLLLRLWWLFRYFMVGPGEGDVTCAHRRESVQSQTRTGGLTRVSVPDGEPTSPYM